MKKIFFSFMILGILAMSFASAEFWNSSGSSVFYNDGYVGIGTSNPTHLLTVNGDINVTGTIFGTLSVTALSGAIAAIGYEVNATGNYSAVIGSYSKAYGEGSTVFGTNNTAWGNYSTAMGNLVTAIGDGSTAMGTNTTAFGGSSTAMGYNTYAGGNHSTAMGYETITIGEESTAMGSNSIASGSYSTAMGFSSSAWGNSSVAMGYGANAINEGSVATGGFTWAVGEYSTAMGYNTIANGSYTVSIGYLTLAEGDNSVAIGAQTTAMGNYSTAMGYNTLAEGYGATAMGYGTIANGTFSTAMGSGTNAYGDSSLAMGYGTNAHGLYSTAMGENTNTFGIGSTAMGYNSAAMGDYAVSMGVNTTAFGVASLAMGNGISALGNYSVAIALSETNVSVNENNVMAILGGNVGIGTSTPSQALTVVGDLNVTGTIYGNVMNGSSGGTSYWSQSGSDISYSDGNVGIGTTSPTYKLEVNGSTIGTLTKGSTYPLLAQSTASANTNAYSALFERANVGTGVMYVGFDAGDGRMYMTQNPNGDTSFTNYDGTTYRTTLFLDASTGYVGIGTTSPSQKLEVNGNVQIGNNLYIGNNAQFYNTGTYMEYVGTLPFYITDAVPTTYIYSANTYLGSSSGDIIRTRGNILIGDDYIINATGNRVGIGTTSPTATLAVTSTATSATFSVVNTNVAELFNMQDSSQACTFGIVSSAITAIGCSSDEKLKEDIVEVPEEKLTEISNFVFNYPLKEYTWKESGEREIGVIAQEVQKLDASKVKDMDVYNAKTDQTESYLGITPPSMMDLIVTIQELKKEIESLKSSSSNGVGAIGIDYSEDIKELSNRITELEKQNSGTTETVDNSEDATEELNSKITQLETENAEMKKALCEIKPELEICK